MKTNKIKEENKTDDEKNKEIIIWDEAYINGHDDGVKQATADFIKKIDERLSKLQGRIKYDEQEDLMRFARKDELEELKQMLVEK
jgi:hypothetical protein